jgi:hypothetical protein
VFIVVNLKNEPFEIFGEIYGFHHDFSSLRNLQQIGVVESKNRSLSEMAHTMISESKSAKRFWAEAAVNTTCYVQNRIYIRLILNKTPYEFTTKKKTPYELLKGIMHNIYYFHQFGCTCYLLALRYILRNMILKHKSVSCLDILNAQSIHIV